MTRRWQDRQRESDLKTQLVADLSEAVTAMVLSIQFVHARRSLPSELADKDVVVARQREFDDAYRDWEIRSAKLRATLQAYFAGTSIPVAWSDLSASVGWFYAQEGVPEADQREVLEKAVDCLRQSFQEDAAPEWGSVKEAIINSLSDLIRRVLVARASVLRPGWSFSKRRI